MVKVRTVVTSDRSVTVAQMKNEVGVSYGTFHIIVEDELLVCRVCVKWSCHAWIAVQQFLVKNQIQTTHPPATVFSTSRSMQLQAIPRHTTGLSRMLYCVLRRNSREHNSGTHGRTEGGLADTLPGRSGPLMLVCMCRRAVF